MENVAINEIRKELILFTIHFKRKKQKKRQHTVLVGRFYSLVIFTITCNVHSNLYIKTTHGNITKVKPVYKGHSWEQNVFVKHKWVYDYFALVNR
jgi:hypothetical protein